MNIPAEKHSDVLQIIKSFVEQSRDDPGCNCFHIYRDIEDSDVLMLQINLKTEEDLILHVSSDEYRNLLLAMEISINRPEVRFDTISTSTGFEIIQKIRTTAHKKTGKEAPDNTAKSDHKSNK